MLRDTRKVNRGPAASADNRRAILAAARKVFTERGYHAPLSAVVKEAGVSQGVLYRHFPTRLELAFAVFDEDWAEYEAISASPDSSSFVRLWTLIIDKTIDEAHSWRWLSTPDARPSVTTEPNECGGCSTRR